ncbi:MAG: hypothetical protein HY675_26075 [Chloroflexi bacterium]|nr:hypothetical protein [Chloroflexota bacterium]
MKGLIRMAVIFAVSLAVAKFVAAFLNSRAGKKLARSTGAEALLTIEGMDLAKKYSREAASLILGTWIGRKEKRKEARPDARVEAVVWPDRLEDAAEMLSATGNLARIVAEFWHDRLELENLPGSRLSGGHPS